MKFDAVGLWVFGYGSLIWRPDFAFDVAHWATVDNWARRFWQGSHDHRGTVDAPGRVLTLVPLSGQSCRGRVFGVSRHDMNDVLRELDYREKNGYERQWLDVNVDDIGPVSALTYIAAPNNIAWLGDASDEEITEHIRRSSGPSGSNKDYVLSLHNMLQAAAVQDSHIETIARLLEK